MDEKPKKKGEQLIDFINSKGEVTLKGVYAEYPTWKKPVVRGFINTAVKKNKITRSSRGVYIKNKI